jgi:hypothetical protein
MDIMTELKARPVVKNKFWIVEEDGHKIATIQAVDEGGFVYVQNEQRQRFSTIKLLSKEYNIVFDKTVAKIKRPTESHEVYGWPTDTKPYNPLYDVTKRLPIYTRDDKSKSYYCAGYYIVKLSAVWSRAYCPKLITLQRYEFAGPFHTIEQQTEQLGIANGE